MVGVLIGEDSMEYSHNKKEIIAWWFLGSYLESKEELNFVNLR